MKNAARFLLEHPEYFNRVETQGLPLPFARYSNAKDGYITRYGLDRELKHVEAQIHEYGLPHRSGASWPSISNPVTPAPPGPKADADDRGPRRSPRGSGSTSDSKVSRIVRDPATSLEEKIQQILLVLTERLDDEILKTTEALDGTKGKGKPTEAKVQSEQEALQLKLQQLIERRKQMFELRSNLSNKFNEMARTAIANLGRA